MSTTPRADAAANPSYCECDPGTVVNIRDARQLEIELTSVQLELGATKGELDDMRAKRDRLAEWKSAATLVESEWDEQHLAKLLGAKPGESCRKAIMKRVPEILAELKEANQDAERLAVCLQAAEEDLLYDIGSLARRALAMHETRTSAS